MKIKKNSTPEMKAIRKKIDMVDNKLLPLMIKRSQLVEKALALKKKETDIIDKKRIGEIKRNISDKTKKLGGNPQLLSRIWISIIDNFIKFEKKKFKK